MSSTYPCKGSGNGKCPTTVTYARLPVLAATQISSLKNAYATSRTQPKRVFLTCTLRHTNAYEVDASGNILG